MTENEDTIILNAIRKKYRHFCFYNLILENHSEPELQTRIIESFFTKIFFIGIELRLLFQYQVTNIYQYDYAQASS